MSQTKKFLRIKLNMLKIPNTSGLVSKTDCNTNIMEIENKIPSVTGLVTTTVLNTETKKKIPDITSLTTKASLNAKTREVESEIPYITNQATKVALNAKATEMENEILDTTGFITIPEFNRLTKISFDAKMKEAMKNIASKKSSKYFN